MDGNDNYQCLPSDLAVVEGVGMHVGGVGAGWGGGGRIGEIPLG